MKKLISLFLVLCFLSAFVGCDTQKEVDTEGKTKITDVFGNTAYLDASSKIVCGYASFAECWLLSGGTLVGVTEDAVSEHGLDTGNAEIVGSVKHINLEKLVSLTPDYVILSADLAAHLSLKENLDAMGIKYGYFRVDVFEDYKSLMMQFCAISGRAELFYENVSAVESEIAEIKAKIPKTDKTVLLMRAFSTGMKAKTDDNLAGVILREFGLLNIADSEKSMLEDLSVEHIVKSDPDFIFAMTMGNEEGALQYLQGNAENNPAWRELTAVKNGNYHLLPKNLFHYKPNNRWSESYEYLAKLIFPEVFGEK